MFLRTPSISSSPSGAPCAALLPALVGAPKPMVVLQATTVGLAVTFALAMAAAMASGSCPSQPIQSQPQARKRGFLVFRGGEAGRAVDGDAVVVEQDDQAIQAPMGGQRGGFVTDAFHQAAVTGQRVGVVIAQRRAELLAHHAFGQRHADGEADALAERAGGAFDAVGKVEFRMSRSLAAETAELFDVVDGDFVAEQIGQRIHQHRAVARRQDETVAVRPFRILRIEFQELREQDRGDVGATERQSGMARTHALDRVHRKGADRIRHVGVGDFGLRRHVDGFLSSIPPDFGPFKIRKRLASVVKKSDTVWYTLSDPGSTGELWCFIQMVYQKIIEK